MKFTYETAVATFIQFILLSLLNVATGIYSIATYHAKNGSGTNNIFSTLVFFLMIVSWFGLVWLLGVLAQAKRSRKLALLLIMAELATALFAFINFTHHAKGDNIIGPSTSIIDLALSLWIVTLAFRLMRSSGGRVVSKQRARKRPAAIKF